MTKTKSYKVAGHVFSFILPDSQKLWDSLEQAYSPFEIPAEEAEKFTADGGRPLFSLELVNELPEGGRECIYDVPTEDGETVVKLYRQHDTAAATGVAGVGDGASAGNAKDSGESWYFETAPDKNQPIAARIWSDHDFRHAKIMLSTRLVRDAVFGINNAAMLMFAFASAFLGTIEMHASVIENGGKAYLFLGKSGTGKSTHSSLWLKHIPGSVLMNDDNPAVRVWPDGRIICYGTPWSGKTPCYKNVEAPVGAYLQLRQWPENIIRKMPVLEAYSSLYSSISGMKDDSCPMADALNDTLDKILSAIPCYHLDCLPDAAAAQLSADTMRR